MSSWNLLGGSLKMETKSAANYLTDTTVGMFTEMVESQNSFAVPVKRSSYEPGMETLSLFGESFETIAGSGESTAQSSETNPSTDQVSLSDKLTQSLISAGLVKGIIPMSIRDVSGQQTLDAVLRELDGEPAGSPK